MYINDAVAHGEHEGLELRVSPDLVEDVDTWVRSVSRLI